MQTHHLAPCRAPRRRQYQSVRNRLLASVCLALSFLGITYAQADSVVHDSFSLNANSRKAGVPLNGLPVEKGQGDWMAAPAFKFGGDDKNGWLMVDSAGSGSARIAVPKGAVVTVEVDAQPASDKVGFIDVGFGGSSDTGDSNFSDGVFLYLDTKGDAQLRSGGAKLKGKHIESYKSDGPNHLVLTYDSASNSVTATVDGEEVGSKVALPIPLKADYTGIGVYGISSSAKITNFSLSVGGASTATDSAVALPPVASAAAPAASAQENPGNEYHILFIGNSITLSTANPGKGWDINAGMAASSVDKDYVHLVTSYISQKKGIKAVPMIFAHHGGVVQNYVGRVDEYRSFHPNLVVIQFGENDHEGVDAFKQIYAKLLDDVNSLQPKPEVICTGMWCPDNQYPLSGNAAAMTDAIRQVAQEKDATFVQIADLSSNPQNKGTGPNGGIRWHPNDNGHKGYADRICAAWDKSDVASK